MVQDVVPEMKSLIIGADGLVGQALARQMPSALKTTHETLDITNYNSLFKLFSDERPGTVYLAAAITNVDACQDASTGATNVGGTTLVLRLCEMFDAKLVWFSSGYVFDGKSKAPYTEQDECNPIQNYGIQKRTVERTILNSKHNALVIRTIGVFGEERGNKNFVKSVAASVTTRKKVFAPTDQYMNPISSYNLATITIGLAQHQTGVWHVAGDETVSKYEFAARVAGYFGKEKLVEGVTSDKLKQKAPRPRMGALDCSELGRVMWAAPSFQKGLMGFLEAEYG